MQKRHSAIHGISLIAATAIGSGIVALPLTLATIGMLPSIILMLITWFFIYHTSLINFELNLQAGKGLALSQLFGFFDKTTGGIIAFVAMKGLFFALLSAYISAANNLINTKFLLDSNFILPTIFFVLLLFPTKFIKPINNYLFIILLGVLLLLLTNLIVKIEWVEVNWLGPKIFELSAYKSALPLLFTSFGFQVIFHTITNYYNKDAQTIKKVAFIGILIPTVLYIIWNTTLLAALQKNFPDFYKELSYSNVSLDRLIDYLALLSPDNRVRILIWWITFLAIITSTIGVGLGLVESLENYIVFTSSSFIRRFISVFLTIVPSLVISQLVPNAFLKVLSVAGALLAIVAILLPLYLFYIIKIKNLYYTNLAKPIFNWLSWVFGLIILLSGF